MVASQNGWRANDRSVVSTRQVAGSGVRLMVRNGPAGDAILLFGAWWDRAVADIDRVADDWGYAERQVRGGSDLSNHASGTAADYDATEHPLATDPARNFTSAQIAAIRRGIEATGNVLRWGGDYRGRKDGMHVEVNDGQDEAACARAVAGLQRLLGAGAPPIVPVNTSGPGVLRRGSKGQAVKDLQAFMRRVFPAYAGQLAVDGDYGPATEAAVREYQSRTPGLAVDGIYGPSTAKAMGR